MQTHTGTRLLVDDYIVEDIWNLRREVVRPAKCIDNPLMVADHPWEGKGVGAGQVMWDEDDQISRCGTMFFDMWLGEMRRNTGTLIGYVTQNLRMG